MATPRQRPTCREGQVDLGWIPGGGRVDQPVFQLSVFTPEYSPSGPSGPNSGHDQRFYAHVCARVRANPANRSTRSTRFGILQSFRGVGGRRKLPQVHSRSTPGPLGSTRPRCGPCEARNMPSRRRGVSVVSVWTSTVPDTALPRCVDAGAGCPDNHTGPNGPSATQRPARADGRETERTRAHGGSR